MSKKPLGQKAYGSTPHFASSRVGPSDSHVHVGQEHICLIQVRDKFDTIFVTEKVDGSNVAIANLDGRIIPMTRAGYIAETSPYAQHKYFHKWVMRNQEKWLSIIPINTLISGEWLLQAHGTRYTLPNGPFVIFDIRTIEDSIRWPFDNVLDLCHEHKLATPKLIYKGNQALPIAEAMLMHDLGSHGLIDDPEGVVYRVERKGAFDFMAKWVRPDKQDGKYLPGINPSIIEPIWNLDPSLL